MRAPAVLLLVIGLSLYSTTQINCNPVRASRALHDDLEDFLALVPIDKIVAIFFEYQETDQEVQFVIEYVQTVEFRELVRVIGSITDVRNFVTYLEESGLKAYDLVNKLHELVGLPPIRSSHLLRARSYNRRITGGVAGLIADVKNTLPLEDIKVLYYEKLETSAEFKELIERLRSPKLQALVDRLYTNEEFLTILETLKGFGVDLPAIANLLYTMLGLNIPVHAAVARNASPDYVNFEDFVAAISKEKNSYVIDRYIKHAEEVKTMMSYINSNPVRASRALHDDLEDFLALVPIDEIVAIFFEYQETDQEVQFVIEYVQTAEFRELVRVIGSITDVRNFVTYLEESGLKAYDLVNKLHELVGLPPIRSSHLLRARSYNRRITGGVAGLIADVKNTLPLEDIKVLYYEKLETSAEFKELIERLRSPKLQALVDRLYTNEEFLTILETLKGFGVDLPAIANLLYTILGLEMPIPAAVARNVSPVYVNFEDFVAAISKEKISYVIDRYIKHDEEIKTIMTYIKTDDFKEVLKIIHNLGSVNYLYQYLDRSGFDIYPFINNIHNSLMEQRTLSNDPLETKKSAVPPTKGLSGLIDELLFSLPLMEWHSLYKDKIVNDKAFQHFVQSVKSYDFKMAVKAVFVDKEFKSAVDRMAVNGFDVTPIIDFISIALHIDESILRSSMIKSRSENLHEDFDDFINLLPVDKIIKISIRYYLVDSDVQKAVGYLQSEEFRKLALKFQQDYEFHKLIKYFKDSGADVVVLINLVNELLGLPEFPVTESQAALKNYFKISSIQARQALNTIDHKTGGMQDMLNEIRGVIPYDDIKALYEIKVENSVHFKYFVERLQAQEHQELIDKLVKNENVLALAYQAHIHGINIEHIGQILFDLFGLKFPENPFEF